MAPGGDNFSLDELVLRYSDESFVIENEVAVDEMDAREQESKLHGIADLLTGDPLAINDPSVFDGLCSFIKYAPQSLNGKGWQTLLETILTGLGAAADQAEPLLDQSGMTVVESQEHLVWREPLERLCFLLSNLVTTAEKQADTAAATSGSARALIAPKAKARSRKGAAAEAGIDSVKFDWTKHLPSVLAMMSRILKIKLRRLWSTTQERDSCVTLFTKPAYELLQNESYIKTTDIRLGIFKIIALAVKFHGHAFGAQTSILQNLQYFEHLSEPMADLLDILGRQYDYGQLAEEVLREVAAKEFGTSDTKGPRSFSRFLVRFAETNPRTILKQMSLLQKHLDSELYPMRIAMIEIIAQLIRLLSCTEEDAPSEQTKSQIDGFFDLLEARFLDVSSYVRARLALVYSRLMDLPAKFPKRRARLIELAVRSLEDKSSHVRKNIIVVLEKMILTHPYGVMHGGGLNRTEWSTRLDKVESELSAMGFGPTKVSVPAQDQEALTRIKPKGPVESTSTPLFLSDEDGEDDPMSISQPDGADHTPKSQRVLAIKGSPGAQILEQALREEALSQADQEKLMALRLTKRYYTDAVQFIDQLHQAVPVLCQLLSSTTKSEVLESMEWFRIAQEYHIEDAEIGIKKMLHLIWTKDNSMVVEDGRELRGIRTRLIECYRSLYFEFMPDLSTKENVNKVTKNMIHLTFGANLAELTSLEQLFSTMMSDGQIRDEIIDKLWQVYSTPKDIPRAQRRGANIVIAMLATAKKEIVTERIDLLLKIGLGQAGKLDPVLCRWSCIALQKLSGSTKKVKGSLTDESIRLPMDNVIFERLRAAILDSAGSAEWFALAEQAINTIYLLGQQPDALCAEIIRTQTLKVHERKKEGNGEDMDLDSSSAEDQKAVTKAMPLMQLIFLVGHTAIKQIVYLEVVERNFKHKKAESEKNAGKVKVKAGDLRGDDELDQVAGTTEDEFGETIADIRERELLYGPRSLLALYGPLIKKACTMKNAHPQVQSVATLALCKLMCVSSRFCEENLLLLFQIMDQSQDPLVRSNITIALGDMAVCFTTLIDENIDRLYRGLIDKDIGVKKNTLMVLTHLILNGMIKVKGQLGEMAKCLEDDDARICDLAKLFFSELSTKDNAIYNNLPDIISHLSVGTSAVDEDTFQKTMRFLFKYIEKEKQAENVVEKLCQRFKATNKERQWRDIAYCLSLLPFKSDRSIKKLIDGLPFYQMALSEETVYKRFGEILTKARTNKANRPDGELKEFEKILETHRQRGEDDHETEGKALAARKKLASKRGRARKRAGS